MITIVCGITTDVTGSPTGGQLVLFLVLIQPGTSVFQELQDEYPVHAQLRLSRQLLRTDLR